jgi:hypothetical protein
VLSKKNVRFAKVLWRRKVEIFIIVGTVRRMTGDNGSNSFLKRFLVVFLPSNSFDIDPRMSENPPSQFLILFYTGFNIHS